MLYTTEEQKKELHTQLMKWLGDSETSTSEVIWQTTAQEDYEFYAGKQDTGDVVTVLESQNRPASTFNEIKPKINMLSGMGDQLEGAVTLMPRTMEDGALTELMTGAVDFFREKMRQSRKENSCFDHAIKSGKSWLHMFVDLDDIDNRLKAERVPGRSVHSDPDAIEPDKSDSRFLFRDKWLDADQIESAFPSIKFSRNTAGFIVNTSFTQVGGRSQYQPIFFNQTNEKYRLVEAWWVKYETKYMIVNPITGKQEDLFEEEYKEFSSAVKKGVQLPDGQLLQKKEIPFQPKLVKSLYTAILTGTEIVMAQRSTYQHGRIPYIYLEAYHDEENNAAQSVIFSMKDPQRGLNTTRRQLIFLLQQINKGILLHEVGAVLNIEDYEQNSAKPGFHMELQAGGLEKVKFLTQPNISPIYAELDRLFQQSMKDSSGIQDALLGIQTSTREPGVTARMRNDSSVAVLYTLFSNLKEFKYNCMKVLLSNIQQFITEPMMIRIQGQKGWELMQINSQLNKSLEGWNDVTAAQFDLIIDEDIVTKSTRLAISEILTTFNQNNPGSIPADLMLEYANLPYTAQVRVKQEAAARQQAAQLQQDIEVGQKNAEIKLEERKVVVLEKQVDNDIKMGNKPQSKTKAK